MRSPLQISAAKNYFFGFATSGAILLAGLFYFNAKSEESDLTNVSVFPNPVMDVLQINTESNVLKYKIVSAQGIVLKEGNAVENAVDVSSLNAGLYFIQLTLENGQEQIKRIIKK